MNKQDLISLAERMASEQSPKRLKFGIYKDEGWVTASSADTIRLLCDVWNNRHDIARTLTNGAEHEG
jgi:hypothetical protein